jgi:hypothetical protein
MPKLIDTINNFQERIGSLSDSSGLKLFTEVKMIDALTILDANTATSVSGGSFLYQPVPNREPDYQSRGTCGYSFQCLVFGGEANNVTESYLSAYKKAALVIDKILSPTNRMSLYNFTLEAAPRFASVPAFQMKAVFFSFSITNINFDA